MVFVITLADCVHGVDRGELQPLLSVGCDGNRSGYSVCLGGADDYDGVICDGGSAFPGGVFTWLSAGCARKEDEQKQGERDKSDGSSDKIWVGCLPAGNFTRTIGGDESGVFGKFGDCRSEPLQ